MNKHCFLIRYWLILLLTFGLSFFLIGCGGGQTSRFHFSGINDDTILIDVGNNDIQIKADKELPKHYRLYFFDLDKSALNKKTLWSIAGKYYFGNTDSSQELTENSRWAIRISYNFNNVEEENTPFIEMNALAKTRYGIDPNSEDHIVSVNFIGIAIHTHQIWSQAGLDNTDSNTSPGKTALGNKHIFTWYSASANFYRVIE